MGCRRSRNTEVGTHPGNSARSQRTTQRRNDGGHSARQQCPPSDVAARACNAATDAGAALSCTGHGVARKYTVAGEVRTGDNGEKWGGEGGMNVVAKRVDQCMF